MIGKTSRVVAVKYARPINAEDGQRRQRHLFNGHAVHLVAAQPTTRDRSKRIGGKSFKVSPVIMTPSHAFGALGREPCGGWRSTRDRSRRAAL